ncbi:MAG: hypothetical protein LBQ46_03460 [Treponema sp.]|nr:hypothetical protein [Treponema sp.]
MKRAVVFLLAMALLGAIGISSLAAQAPTPPTPDDYNAVPTLSTEARYSAGLFTTYVDDFIDVNGYDPDIGTFLFLGGFGQGTSGVDQTNFGVIGPYSGGDYGISAGFAKSFSNFYLGVYLGGNVVDANGNSSGDPKQGSATATWNTRLAVLFGTSRIGGLRLDLIMDDVTDTTSTYKNKTVTGTSGEGATVALSWGNSNGFRGLEPHVTLGFRFPDNTLATDATGGNRTRTWTDAAWLLSGGISKGLGEISTLELDLSLNGLFGEASIGQNSDTTPGGFGLQLDAALANEIEPLDGLAFAFQPNLSVGFYAGDSGQPDPYSTFDLIVGFDAAAKVRLPGRFDKFTLVTGFGLNIFNWAVETTYASALQDSWTVDGISWDTEKLSNVGSLGLGLVFEPIEGFSVGCGLNTLLDNIFEFDLPKMQVRAGQWFSGNSIPLAFDLTVSYKF